MWRSVLLHMEVYSYNLILFINSLNHNFNFCWMGDKHIEQANSNITFKFFCTIIPNSKEICIFHVEVGS